MKLKSIADGTQDDNISNEQTTGLISNIERQSRRPFPQQNFMQFVRTLSDYEKLMLAITLQLPFTRKDLRKWPDLLFLKKLSLVLKKTTDMAIRQQLLIYISSVMISNPSSLEQLNENLAEQIEEHGYWSVYWTIYYHIERDNNEELCVNMLEKLNTTLPPTIQGSANQEVAATDTDITVPTLIQDQNKYEKKIALLEDKISKEISTRQQLELTGAQKDKMHRQLQQEQDKLLLQAQQLKEQLRVYEQKIERVEQGQLEITQRRKEEEDRWLIERNQLLQQNKQHLDDLKKSAQLQEQLLKELEEVKKQSANWQQLAQQKQETVKPTTTNITNSLTQQLTAAMIGLHRELDQYNEEVLLTLESSAFEQNELRAQYRQQMRLALQLTEEIDAYQQTSQHFKQNLKSMELAKEDTSPIEAVTIHNTLTKPSSNLDTENTTQKQANMLFGTFYRRDHGGYISLENGDIFNITESLVQQLDLQHEAEVLCTPTAHPGRTNHYTIELLFQGDDDYSPINQYDGFVQQDEDLKWYCVDINDEDNRFPIHFKDIEIQKPNHGDPCTFNVAEDGHIARLTRLYRLQGDSIDVHPARKKTDKPKETNHSSVRQKIEPFLTDCTVTIIGGQRKWFESVVKETGAELVHDGGERPERIASDLSRSQALFMILTSTSHRATWEGVEIAKTNNVPHFVIQGSKSNLRMLLWENQELIRTSNRIQEARL